MSFLLEILFLVIGIATTVAAIPGVLKGLLGGWKDLKSAYRAMRLLALTDIYNRLKDIDYWRELHDKLHAEAKERL